MSKKSMWCRLHNDSIDWSTFEYKGCWGCQHFSGLNPDKHMYVSEAAELFKVTEQTIQRWIKKGILKSTLYKRGRSQFSLSSPPTKHVINRKSVGLLQDKHGISSKT